MTDSPTSAVPPVWRIGLCVAAAMLVGAVAHG